MKRSRSRFVSLEHGLLAVSCLIGSFAAAETPQASWSQFQNGGYPVAPEDSLALNWSPSQNIVWRATIEGYGQSAPVVADGKVYVTSVSGDQRQTYHLAAYRLDDGEVIWRREFPNPSPQENTAMTSRAAPTCLADPHGCIAFFEGGLIVSLGHNGETQWFRNLVEDYGAIEARHGLASSLEQDESLAFVWVERASDPYLLAMDKGTGATIWKADGLGATTWASPRLIPVDDGQHLVCSAGGKLVGMEPSTGRRLWEFTDIANNTSCTPVPVQKNRFLIGASDGRGETSDGSGAASNGVIEVKKAGDGYEVSYVWKAEKASSSFGTPIVAGEWALIVNRAGVLYRLRADNGEQVSARRTSAGAIWATPIVSGDRLYLFGYKGTTSVISLTDDEELAENRLWEATAGESAFQGSVLYAATAAPPYLILRRGDMLYAVSEPD